MVNRRLILLPPLLFVHFLNLLFHNPNGLVEPVRVVAHPLDFNGRKPLAGLLRRFAERLDMSGPHEERQVIIQPTLARLNSGARRDALFFAEVVDNGPGSSKSNSQPTVHGRGGHRIFEAHMGCSAPSLTISWSPSS